MIINFAVAVHTCSRSNRTIILACGINVSSKLYKKKTALQPWNYTLIYIHYLFHICIIFYLLLFFFLCTNIVCIQLRIYDRCPFLTHKTYNISHKTNWPFWIRIERPWINIFRAKTKFCLSDWLKFPNKKFMMCPCHVWWSLTWALQHVNCVTRFCFNCVHMYGVHKVLLKARQ